MQQELDAPLHPRQKRQVLEAIRTLGFKVVPADVAAQSDLPVLTTTYQLNQIAAETNAHLEVSADGNITYAFDPGFERAYALSGPRNALRLAGRVSINAGLMVARFLFVAAFFLLRISFGVVLIASVVAVVAVAVMAIMSALRGSGDGNGGGSGGGGIDLIDLMDLGSGNVFDARPLWLYFAFDWLWDWIYLPVYINPYSARRHGYIYGFGYGYGYSPLLLLLDNDESSLYPSSSSASKSTSQSAQSAQSAQLKDGSGLQSPKKKSKFLDNCFTLLFGEGDANAQTEEKRWREIAQVIRSNQGVITCEQVAPYLEAKPGTEDWMLPVLLRFNGVPEVTEAGNILYSFPVFQQNLRSQPSIGTGALSNQGGTRSNQSQEALPPGKQDAAGAPTDTDALRALYSGHLNRQRILKQTESNKRSIEPYLKENMWDFGNLKEEDLWPIFGFAGFALIGSLTLLHWAALPVVHMVAPILIAIAIYGSLYFVIPAIRWFVNQKMNEKIAARHEQRLEWAAKLASPSRELENKLSESRAFGVHALVSQDNRLVYTTREDALEQQFADRVEFGSGTS